MPPWQPIAPPNSLTLFVSLRVHVWRKVGTSKDVVRELGRFPPEDCQEVVYFHNAVFKMVKDVNEGTSAYKASTLPLPVRREEEGIRLANNAMSLVNDYIGYARRRQLDCILNSLQRI